MKVKLGIIKATAEGEQVNVEGELDTDQHEITRETLQKEFEPFFGLIDDRLREMNMRVIASNHLVKRMPAEAQQAIHNAHDMLYGRAPKEEVKNIFEEVRQEVQENEDKAVQVQAERVNQGRKGGKGGHEGGPVGNA